MLIKIGSELRQQKRKFFKTTEEQNEFLSSNPNFVKVGLDDVSPNEYFGNKFALKYYDSSFNVQPDVDYFIGNREEIKEKLIRKFKTEHRKQNYEIGKYFYVSEEKTYENQLNKLENGIGRLYHLYVSKKDESITSFPAITLDMEAIDIVII